MAGTNAAAAFTASNSKQAKPSLTNCQQQRGASDNAVLTLTSPTSTSLVPSLSPSRWFVLFFCRLCTALEDPFTIDENVCNSFCASASPSPTHSKRCTCLMGCMHDGMNGDVVNQRHVCGSRRYAGSGWRSCVAFLITLRGRKSKAMAGIKDSEIA